MSILFHSPINGLSYGIVGKQIFKSLSKISQVALFNIGQISDIDELDAQVINTGLLLANEFDYTAPCIKLWHQFDLHIMPKCSKRIGFPIFELDKFNKTELHSIKSCDELFVCSKWAKGVCINNQIELPLHVIPLGVDNAIFKQTKNKSTDVFKILAIGKIEIRKGHDILPDCILKALKNDDNYELNMIWSNPFLKQEEIVEWENFYRHKLGRKVNFIPRITTSQMVDIMSENNVILSLSRAEGWNLGLLEAMACGTNVIATNYSAHTEFCNNENSDLISIDGVETAHDGVWFTSGIGNWAKPNVNHAADLLRARYDEWKAGTLSTNKAGIETAKQFSWDNSAKKIMEIL